MKILNIFIVAITLTLSYSICYGESPVSADLALFGSYVDNIYQTSSPESDYISLTQLDLSCDFDSGTSIFYDASLNLFSRHFELHNQEHYLGIKYEKDLLQGDGLLFFSSNLGLQENTDEYSLYDRYAGNIYADFKYYFSETLNGKVGYSMDYESYPNYQPFSFFENSGFLKLSKSFQTRTSLHLGLNAGWRRYPDLEDQSGLDHSTQVTGSAKIAQSLTENTGLQLQYSWHYVPQSIRYDEVLDEGYFFIEDILEDEYSFSRNKYQMTLKRMGSWNTMLNCTLARENRTYNVSLLDGDQNRRDSNTTLYLKIEKKLSLSINPLKDMALHVEFLHRNSNSNDNEFDYSMNVISIGTKAAF